MMRKQMLLGLSVLATLLTGVVSGQGRAPVLVNCDGNLQWHIDRAQPGSILELEGGEYEGPIDLGGKLLHLRGQGGRETATIVAPAQGGRTLLVDGCPPGTRIEGITLRGGSAILGGGILVRSSSLRVIDCAIEGAQATAGDGGGLFCQDSEVIVRGTTFRGCTATGDGGAIFCQGGTLRMESCLLADNMAARAGALRLTGSASAEFVHLTSAGNVSTSVGRTLVVAAGAGLKISHSILSANTPPGAFVGPAATLNLSDSVAEGTLSGPNVLLVDPEFRDPATGDYRLRFTSPARDASASPWPRHGLDFEGQPRVVGASSDWGADEWPTTSAFALESSTGPRLIADKPVTLTISGVPGMGVLLGATSGFMQPEPSPFGEDYVLGPTPLLALGSFSDPFAATLPASGQLELTWHWPRLTLLPDAVVSLQAAFVDTIGGLPQVMTLSAGMELRVTTRGPSEFYGHPGANDVDTIVYDHRSDTILFNLGMCYEFAPWTPGTTITAVGTVMSTTGYQGISLGTDRCFFASGCIDLMGAPATDLALANGLGVPVPLTVRDRFGNTLVYQHPVAVTRAPQIDLIGSQAVALNVLNPRPFAMTATTGGTRFANFAALPVGAPRYRSGLDGGPQWVGWAPVTAATAPPLTLHGTVTVATTHVDQRFEVEDWVGLLADLPALPATTELMVCSSFPDNDSYTGSVVASVPVNLTFGDVLPGGVALTASGLGVAGTSSRAVLADLNGDQSADLVVPGAVHAGTGTLCSGLPCAASVSTTPLGVVGRPSATGDWNGDGMLDLVTTDGPSNPAAPGRAATTQVFLGNGAGVFPGPAVVTMAAGDFEQCAVTMTDLDGDGAQDLLVVTRGGLEIGWGAPAGPGFAARTSLISWAGVTTGSALAVQDLDGNGTRDLVLGGHVRELSVLWNPGAGRRDPANWPEVVLRSSQPELGPARSGPQPVVQSGADVALGDFDGDGRIDIGWSSTDRTGAFLQTQVGQFTFARAGFSRPTLGIAPRVVAVDVNGDGQDELVAPLEYEGAGFVTVAFHTAGQGFDRRSVIPLGTATPTFLEVGDLNGDGRPDLLVGGSEVQAILLP